MSKLTGATGGMPGTPESTEAPSAAALAGPAHTGAKMKHSDSSLQATEIAVPTAEEEARLGSGASFWVTEPIGAAGAILMTDGPHGVRRQTGAADQLGIAPSHAATCFPPAVALAQSWDAALCRSVGQALGVEARSLEVDVLLGPGINIKRDPRCGRNFEYFSEDPFLSGVLGAAWVQGLQSRGVGAAVKHFALNNQEHERMRTSSDVDERTLREIYLRAFERVVKEAEPWTVMAAYNRINGVPATQNRELLTEILRDEWGFDGVVISDWGAVSDRVKAVAAGLDLQMPGGDDEPDQLVIESVRADELDAQTLNTSSRRLRRLAGRVAAGRDLKDSFGLESHHSLAREIAGRCIVLLKNENDVLPLAPTSRLAVIGEFASHPRIQGGGSSRVNPIRVDNPLHEIMRLAPEAIVEHAPGYSTDGSKSEETLVNEAVRIASNSDAAVVFLGLSPAQEAEGADRRDIEIPSRQLDLLRSVAAVQPNTVVVLTHGGVLRLAPVDDVVPAILDCTLLGEAGGGAIADVVFGAVNPSGKLAETVPLRLEDTPSFLNYPGENLRVLYGERIFVGYRGYDKRRLDVSFPFGHGLSYTTFAYSDLEVAVTDDGIAATVAITNTGTRDGRETVQLYIQGPGAVLRPPRELKAFDNVFLHSGQTKRVSFTVSRLDLSYWETRSHSWALEYGDFTVDIGSSSRDIRISAKVHLDGDELALPLTPDSSIGELMANPFTATTIKRLLTASEGADPGSAAAEELGIDAASTVAGIPIGRLRALSGGRGPTRVQLADLLANANQAVK